MKSSVLLISLSVVFLAACSNPLIKETRVVEKQTPPVVVEKQTPPVVVEKQTPPIVVERQVPITLRNCTSFGTAYSHGTISCQNGFQYQCNDGFWDSLNATC